MKTYEIRRWALAGMGDPLCSITPLRGMKKEQDKDQGLQEVAQAPGVKWSKQKEFS